MSFSVDIKSLRLNQKVLFDEVSFNVDSDNIFFLKGPNGSGKSIMLTFLSGWDKEKVDINVTGEISAFSQTFNFPNDHRQYREFAKKNMAFLSNHIREESLGVTFGEEMELILNRYENKPIGLIQSAIDYLSKYYSEESLITGMSDGHRQLLALIDTVADYSTCDILLLDEPTSYLSDFLVDKIFQILKWLLSSNPRCIIILATNDQRLEGKGFPEINLPGRNDSMIEKIDSPIISINKKSIYSPIGIYLKGKPIRNASVLPFNFDFNFHIDQSILITGPNGSGKSTLLHVCAGLLKIKGKSKYINLHGNYIKKRCLFPQYLSILFQEPHAYEFRDKTADILQLPQYCPEKQRNEIQNIMTKTCEIYNIPYDQKPITLSSGQLRILWILSMLGWSGRWLLDEPDTSLDSNSLKLLKDVLNAHLSLGGTVIIVTHNKSFYEDFSFIEVNLDKR